MEKRLKTVLLILFLASAALFYVFFSEVHKEKKVVDYKVPINTPAPVNAMEDDPISVVSPDKKVEISINRVDDKTSTHYSLSVTDKSTNLTKTIFTKTVPPGVVITVPFNTFSPDNKFIFLKEMGDGYSKHFVLSLSGRDIVQGSQTIDIEPEFAEKYPDFKITDVTGWGGINLIVVNTDKIEGGIGPSFWFDIGSSSFIRLSTRFN